MLSRAATVLNKIFGGKRKTHASFFTVAKTEGVKGHVSSNAAEIIKHNGGTIPKDFESRLRLNVELR